MYSLVNVQKRKRDRAYFIRFEMGSDYEFSLPQGQAVNLTKSFNFTSSLAKTNVIEDHTKQQFDDHLIDLEGVEMKGKEKKNCTINIDAGVPQTSDDTRVSQLSSNGLDYENSSESSSAVDTTTTVPEILTNPMPTGGDKMRYEETSKTDSKNLGALNISEQQFESSTANSILDLPKYTNLKQDQKVMTHTSHLPLLSDSWCPRPTSPVSDLSSEHVKNAQEGRWMLSENTSPSIEYSISQNKALEEYVQCCSGSTTVPNTPTSEDNYSSNEHTYHHEPDDPDYKSKTGVELFKSGTPAIDSNCAGHVMTKQAYNQNTSNTSTSFTENINFDLSHSLAEDKILTADHVEKKQTFRPENPISGESGLSRSAETPAITHVLPQSLDENLKDALPKSKSRTPIYPKRIERMSGTPTGLTQISVENKVSTTIPIPTNQLKRKNSQSDSGAFLASSEPNSSQTKDVLLAELKSIKIVRRLVSHFNLLKANLLSKPGIDNRPKFRLGNRNS